MSKIFLKVSVAVLISTAMSSCVTANADGVKQYPGRQTTVSGERLQLTRASGVKMDCSVRMLPEMRIIQAPKNGTTEIVHEKVEGKYRDEYKHCTGKEVTGTVAYYTSKKGFVGHDQVTIRVSTNTGIVFDRVMNITVVK